MNGSTLQFEKPIGDAVSRIRFAPQSDNLLISSWDSNLRLYDVDSSQLRLEASSRAALLDCCFQSESMALTAGSDGCIRRYDLHSGANDTVGSHYDMATCVGYNDETCYAVGCVDGRVALEFLDPSNSNKRYAFRCHPKSKDGRAHLVSVNDIVFNPLVCGTFITGDNDGYIIAWNDESKRKLHEFPRYPNSVASLSFNHVGELLAIASSYTYQEANEMEVSPQIFIQKMGDS
ncbi:mitotic checkpoint protein BUB3.3 isoform X2 [Jatropha curcas]|uniref:mitotic checkpoint protein BUB3.3 isoform X2 n=1 Tax=Jatropha curcas TaxID=180498 RepID=UPI0005FB30FE|nr:mitotic checkpoint protein BUB3.3 isoform X2 [Jatropha curcas]